MDDLKKYEEFYKSMSLNSILPCTLYLIMLYTLEAVYRYYESRRRIINDSSENRKEQVFLNKKKTKRRVAQKQ